MVIVRIAAGTHTHMVQKVLRASAPLFFDVVPAGRILNPGHRRTLWYRFCDQ